MSEMKIKALAPWFGGKRTLAPRIIAELGEHRSYWEPFCGSMAVLLAKPPCSMETVNDLHGDLINLANIIRDPSRGPELYRRLRRVLMAQGVHKEYADALRFNSPSDEMERAVAFFVVSWMGRNGVIGSRGYNYGYCARYTQNGGHAATRFANAVKSIPAWRRRLREVNILSMDTFELIPRIEDASGVAIYADPPYIVKGAKYVHDFAESDHARLADMMQRFKKSRVVISYYDHPRLDELYPGWTKVFCTTNKALAAQNKRGSVRAKAPEVLLINGPSYVEKAAGATP